MPGCDKGAVIVILWCSWVAIGAQVALGRRDQDDRDHYCNKRLDLGGPLLANLFRQLFRKLTKDVRSHVQKAVDRGKTPHARSACRRHRCKESLVAAADSDMSVGLLAMPANSCVLEMLNACVMCTRREGDQSDGCSQQRHNHQGPPVLHCNG